MVSLLSQNLTNFTKEATRMDIYVAWLHRKEEKYESGKEREIKHILVSSIESKKKPLGVILKIQSFISPAIVSKIFLNVPASGNTI